MLVDGDPLGGGLDVLLGGETDGGTALAGVRRLAGPGRRRCAGGVAARSCTPCACSAGTAGTPWLIPPGGDAVGARRGAAARRRGRRRPAAPDRRSAWRRPSPRLDLGLLVVPAELRAVAAAAPGGLRGRSMVLRDLRRGAYAGPVTRGRGLDDGRGRAAAGTAAGRRTALGAGLLAAAERGVPPGARYVGRWPGSARPSGSRRCGAGERRAACPYEGRGPGRRAA